MKALRTQKAISWPERLKDTPIGGEIPVSVLSITTVRQCISRLKAITKLRFETRQIDKTKVMVKRVA